LTTPLTHEPDSVDQSEMMVKAKPAIPFVCDARESVGAKSTRTALDPSSLLEW